MEDKLRSYYEDEFYKDIRSSSISPNVTNRYLSNIDLLNIGSKSLVLDIGCGDGSIGGRIIEEGSRVIGIDFAMSPLKVAKLNQPQGEWILGSGQALPFRDKCFDYILFMGSLEHFSDLNLGLSEAKRCITDKGKILALVPNKWFPPFLFSRGTGQKQEVLMSLKKWSSFLTENGLVIKKISYDAGRTLNYSSPRRLLSGALINFFNLFPLFFRYQFIFVCERK